MRGPTVQAPTRGAEPFALGILVCAALGFVACAATWLTAHLTLLADGQGWPAAPFERSPTWLIQLVTRHDAEAAWATTYPGAGRLDPEWLFWLILGMFFAAMAVVIGWASIRWLPTAARWGITSGAGLRVDAAAWATRRQEQPLAVPDTIDRRRWRLVAGRSLTSRRLLAGDDAVSAVCFGPNGSGKTTALIVPNVLDWDGPVVMTTAKPQDLHPICSARAERGPVWVIAPGGAPGHDTTGWSPLDSATTPDAADRIAEWMVDASGMTADPKSRPWNAQARKYLKGLLLAAHHSDAGMEQWVDWIYAGERARDHIEDILHTAGHRRVAAEYASTWQIHDEGKGSVLFTALGLADTYSRPGILTAASGAGFQPDQLFDQAGGTLCLVTPQGEGDRFAAYFTTVLSAVIHEAETRAAATGGPLTPRLLLALDEAGNVFRYPRLPHLLATSRGNGIQLLLVYHDLAQIEHLYGGREVARTVVSNAKLRLLLPGVGDVDTLRYWSELIGRTRTQTHSETRSVDGTRSHSSNEHADDLAPVHLLQQIPNGQAVLLYQNIPPIRLTLLPWFNSRRYQSLKRLNPSAGHEDAA